MRPTRRLWSGLVIPALAFLPLAGCFETANPSELSCTHDKYCPDGYVCVGAQTGSPGRCQKPADAGQTDGTVVGDGADGRPDLVSSDGTDLSTDGTDGRASADGSATDTDAPTVIDQAPAADTSNDPGMASDLPASPDLGHDVPSDAQMSPPDTPPPDNTVPPPDVGPDQKPDVPPDLPYGPEVGPDLPPSGCVIGGTTYARDASNPTNTCQICKPAESPSGWSNVDDGTSCNGGQYCVSGVCKAGCFISGVYYENGAANPANVCQNCQTAYTSTAWTTSANGAACGTGQVCNGGACQSGCWIDGTMVGSGTTNSANVCQVCRPAASTSGWSNNTDGTGCGAGRVCATGKCQCPSSAPNLCDTCVNTQTDPNNCGGCNLPCGANRSCNGGACQCLGQKFSCGTCASWNFESNNPEGWTGTDPYSGGAFGSPTVASTPGNPSFAGSYSLAFASSYGKQAAVFVNLCGSGGTTTDVSGFSISMYFDGPAYPGGIDLVKLHDTTGADLMGTAISPPGPRTWFTVSSTFSTVSAQYLEIDVIPTSGPWSGTVYVDNVQFTP